MRRYSSSVRLCSRTRAGVIGGSLTGRSPWPPTHPAARLRTPAGTSPAHRVATAAPLPRRRAMGNDAGGRRGFSAVAVARPAHDRVHHLTVPQRDDVEMPAAVFAPVLEVEIGEVSARPHRRGPAP